MQILNQQADKEQDNDIVAKILKKQAGKEQDTNIVAKILKNQADNEVVYSWSKVTAPTAQAAVPRRWRGGS